MRVFCSQHSHSIPVTKKSWNSWAYSCFLCAMIYNTGLMQAEEIDPAQHQQVNEEKVKESDWCSVKTDASLKVGEMFHFSIQLKKDQKDMKLVSALHWFDQKEVYGGVIKSYKAISSPTTQSEIKEETVFNFLPEQAKFFVVVSHISPTGGWKDRVTKCSSHRIKYLR